MITRGLFEVERGVCSEAEDNCLQPPLGKY